MIHRSSAAALAFSMPALALLGSCREATSTPVALEVRASDEQEMASALGSYRVFWRSEPAPIPENREFALELRIESALDGVTLPADLALAVDAAMPQHRHGMNVVPVIERIAPDRWRARGMLFHMSGAWTLSIDLSSSGLTERAQCVVHLP